MEVMGGAMLVEVYKRCYDFAGRDEFKVIPYKCPMNKKFCFGGYVWIGEDSPVYDIKEECKCYDKDSFKSYDNRIECNFYLGMENDRQSNL
jgi:hypothetical protein